MTKEVSLSTPKPNCYQVYGVPEESKHQRIAMQTAAKLSKSNGCCDRHFVSTAHAIKAVAIAFFNTLYYIGRGLVRFTICVFRCECKMAFKKLGNDLVDSGKSLTLVAISVIYVGLGFFFPNKIYPFFAPIDSISGTIGTDPNKNRDTDDLNQKNADLTQRLSEVLAAYRKLLNSGLNGGSIDLDKLEELEKIIAQLRAEIKARKGQAGDSSSTEDISANGTIPSTKPGQGSNLEDLLQSLASGQKNPAIRLGNVATTPAMGDDVDQEQPLNLNTIEEMVKAYQIPKYERKSKGTDLLADNENDPPDVRAKNHLRLAKAELSFREDLGLKAIEQALDILGSSAKPGVIAELQQLEDQVVSFLKTLPTLPPKPKKESAQTPAEEAELEKRREALTGKFEKYLKLLRDTSNSPTAIADIKRLEEQIIEQLKKFLNIVEAPADSQAVPTPPVEGGIPVDGGISIPNAPPMDGDGSIPQAPPMDGDGSIPQAPPMDGPPEAPPMDGVPMAPPMGGAGSTAASAKLTLEQAQTLREFLDKIAPKRKLFDDTVAALFGILYPLDKETPPSEQNRPPLKFKEIEQRLKALREIIKGLGPNAEGNPTGFKPKTEQRVAELKAAIAKFEKYLDNSPELKADKEKYNLAKGKKKDGDQANDPTKDAVRNCERLLLQFENKISQMKRNKKALDSQYIDEAGLETAYAFLPLIGQKGLIFSLNSKEIDNAASKQADTVEKTEKEDNGRKADFIKEIWAFFDTLMVMARHFQEIRNREYLHEIADVMNKHREFLRPFVEKHPKKATNVLDIKLKGLQTPEQFQAFVNAWFTKDAEVLKAQHEFMTQIGKTNLVNILFQKLRDFVGKNILDTQVLRGKLEEQFKNKAAELEATKVLPEELDQDDDSAQAKAEKLEKRVKKLAALRNFIVTNVDDKQLLALAKANWNKADNFATMGAFLKILKDHYNNDPRIAKVRSEVKAQAKPATQEQKGDADGKTPSAPTGPVANAQPKAPAKTSAPAKKGPSKAELLFAKNKQL